MRIDGNSRAGAPAARRAGRNSAGSGSNFVKTFDGEPQVAPASVAAASVVDGLLAFQEVEDATSGPRRRALQRGSDLLDRLDELKLGILTGEFSSTRLSDLADLARSSRSVTHDPQLDEVLGEIELRAAVELAKLEQRS